MEVPRGSKSSNSSSLLFEGALELWEGIEPYISKAFDLVDDFGALEDILSWALLQDKQSKISKIEKEFNNYRCKCVSVCLYKHDTEDWGGKVGREGRGVVIHR